MYDQQWSVSFHIFYVSELNDYYQSWSVVDPVTFFFFQEKTIFCLIYIINE